MSIDDENEFLQKLRNKTLQLGQDGHIKEDSVRLFKLLNDYDYSYLWSWMGVPIIQIPPDIVATQEAIWSTKPDVIVDVGVARGGSVIFMASVLSALGNPNSVVVGVDIDVRPHNRQTITNHPLSHKVRLIEGNSLDPVTFSRVKELIQSDSRVMVVLDSDHSYEHVLAECRLYSELVTSGCYLVVTNTILGRLDETDTIRRSKVYKKGDDPLTALQSFLSQNNQFRVDEYLNGKLVFSQSYGGFCLRVEDRAAE